MPFAQLPLINTHADVSGDDSGRIFCLNLYLHTHFLYASNDNSKICSYAKTRLSPRYSSLGAIN